MAFLYIHQNIKNLGHEICHSKIYLTDKEYSELRTLVGILCVLRDTIMPGLL